MAASNESVPGKPKSLRRFGGFELDPQARELTKDNRRIRLQEQPFLVLAMLLERAGQVVTREELRQRLWPSSVYVDFDHGLNNAIARLREALGDVASTPRFIETLPRLGYRFIHAVEESPPPAPEAADARPGRTRLLATAGAVLAALAIAAVLLSAIFDPGADDAAGRTIRSIAVLPFRDLSGSGEQDHLAAGITEALITRLAQDGSLRVISRRASAQFGDSGSPIASIARELQVDGVVEGSLVRHRDELRIDVQLVRAADEGHAWAQSYQRSLDDVFALQRELADDISREIGARVHAGREGQASLPHTDNLEAYDLYLQGRHLWNKRSQETVSKSVELFQEAIRLDPDFAAAHAGLARAYSSLGGHTMVKMVPAGDVREAALAAASRAIELDAGLPEAHLAMATVLSLLFLNDGERVRQAEQAYQLALRLDPASSETRHSYANFLSNRRRSDEAIAQYREALLLDPMSPSIMGRLGMELVARQQAEEGIRLMQRAVEIEPWQFNAQLRLGWAYAASGRFDEASKAIAVAEQVSPGSLHTLAARSYVAARTNDAASAIAALKVLEARAVEADAPFLVAIVYVGLQDRDGAIAWLEKAAASSFILGRPGHYGLDSPIYDWLRDDPRFARVQRLAREAARNPES